MIHFESDRNFTFLLYKVVCFQNTQHRVIVYFSGEDLEDIGDFEEMGRENEIENEIENQFGGWRAIFRNYVLWFSLYLFIVFNL